MANQISSVSKIVFSRLRELNIILITKKLLYLRRYLLLIVPPYHCLWKGLIGLETLLLMILFFLNGLHYFNTSVLYCTWGISFMVLFYIILATVSFGSKELLVLLHVTSILITSCMDISLVVCGYTILSLQVYTLLSFPPIPRSVT
jgi:hypothetical protein